MSIHEQMRNFIMENLVIFDDDVELGDDDNIFEMGFVNSLFAMKLITYIEKEYQIVIDSEEIDISNFNSLNNVVRFIQSKKAL